LHAPVLSPRILEAIQDHIVEKAGKCRLLKNVHIQGARNPEE
jgi:hypothetical protein